MYNSLKKNGLTPWCGAFTLGDKILHRVVQKKFLELPVKLGCQSLVVADHQGRFLNLFYNIGHRKGLPRTGDAHQGLM